jgi:dTDP-4-dehydrorhamnose reductase
VNVRILLIGRTGQLGGDLLRNGTEHEIISPDRGELDVTRQEQVVAVLKLQRPDIVVNCAAFHNVPLCEKEPATAFRINCVAMRDLAAACRNADARFVTFSSDYVFRGDRRTPYSEDDLPGPVQIYGITRLAGEHAVMSSAPEHAIVIRTCGLYGTSGARSKGGNFVDGRVADGRSGKVIEMSDDQTVCPTSTEDLSRAVLQLIGRADAKPGIYHLVNEGQCTWYEFTAEIFRVMGLSSANVAPVNRGGRTGDMRRPLFSVLENTKARRLGVVMPPWRDALGRYLRRKYPEAFGALPR